MYIIRKLRAVTPGAILIPASWTRNFSEKKKIYYYFIVEILMLLAITWVAITCNNVVANESFAEQKTTVFSILWYNQRHHKLIS